MNNKLMDYFNLGPLEENWEKLIDKLGADNYSDGETLGGFTTYFPDYIGPDFNALFEINRFDIWGIKPVEIYSGKDRNIVFSDKPPMRDMDDIEDINKYPFPKIEWFDFSAYRNNSEQVEYKSHKEQKRIELKDFKKSDEYFLNTSCMNSIFMVATYLRGIEKFLMDLVLNEKYVLTLLEKIGEFMVLFNEKNLKCLGRYIDLYGVWDDFADQGSLMISPALWRKYFKGWYKILIDEAKKHNLLVCFHVCGSCVEIIPDLIEMGVDILDPVQVSAKNMELVYLKKRFGRDICFHGGIDSQKFLPFAKPGEVSAEIKRIKTLFGDDGGIILGPSHYLTPDIPVENIIAMYKD
ncbi:MAG: uroporphyrinogen decarboxylase family protein [Actinomycetota bacterium]|nr:uroporphyrinogen decarboxylase family protein [Actinomycetota bacterium]